MALIFIALMITGSVVYFTRGKIFAYLKGLNMSEGAIFASLHIFLSILCALILPNNFLNKSDYINSLYRQYEFLIPLSMILILIISLILIGGLISLIRFLLTKSNAGSETSEDINL